MGTEILERPARKPVVLTPGALPEAERTAEPPPALERLHALVRKGYRPEIGTDTATGSIVLRHVGRAPDLVLHSDGSVEGRGGRVPRYKRDVEPPPAFGVSLAEQLRFMRFLDSVPKATLWDRTRRFRHKYVYLPLAFAILVAVHLFITAMILEGDDPAPTPAQIDAAAPAAAANGEPAAAVKGDPAAATEAAIARETAAAAEAARKAREQAAEAAAR